MSDCTTPIAPTVHLNGTSRSELCAQLEGAIATVAAAIDGVACARPHGRDYYVQADPEAFTKAASAHEARLQALNHIEVELTSILEAVLATDPR